MQIALGVGTSVGQRACRLRWAWAPLLGNGRADCAGRGHLCRATGVQIALSIFVRLVFLALLLHLEIMLIMSNLNTQNIELE